MNIRVLHHENHLHAPTIKTSRFNSYMGTPLLGDDMPRTAEAATSAIRRMISATSRILEGQEGRIVITHGYSLPTVDTVQNGLRHVLFTTLIPATEAPDYLDNSHLFGAGAGSTFDALIGLGIPVFIHIMRSYAVNGRGITAGEVVRTVVNPNSNANVEVERLQMYSALPILPCRHYEIWLLQTVLLMRWSMVSLETARLCIPPDR